MTQKDGRPTNFIDYRLAIGMFVVAGIEARWNNNRIESKRGEMMVVCYRDGTTWKCKESAVQDSIEDGIHN